MTETEFWQTLEFRISRDLARMEDRTLRFLWCDGFVPEQYLFDDPNPQIIGHAWICNGPRQARWLFTLFVDVATRVRADISWSTLLPPDDTFGWFVLDLDTRRIELSPSRANAA